MESATDEKSLHNGFSEEDYLYDPILLKQLNWSVHKASFRPDISPSNPGEHLVMRPLSIEDFDRGFSVLLNQLTDVGNLSKEKYIERFHYMKSCPNTYFTTVIQDQRTSMIVGAATLVVEQKFIHGAASRGRIEDVVVSELCRGQQLGKLLVDTLNVLSQELGCYKLSLECKDDNVKFYQSLGFVVDQNYMVQRFSH